MGSGETGWENGDSVGADLRVCPEAAGTRDRGRHAGLPLRPTPFPHYLLDTVCLAVLASLR